MDELIKLIQNTVQKHIIYKKIRTREHKWLAAVIVEIMKNDIYKKLKRQGFRDQDTVD